MPMENKPMFIHSVSFGGKSLRSRTRTRSARQSIRARCEERQNNSHRFDLYFVLIFHMGHAILNMLLMLHTQNILLFTLTPQMTHLIPTTSPRKTFLYSVTWLSVVSLLHHFSFLDLLWLYCIWFGLCFSFCSLFI